MKRNGISYGVALAAAGLIAGTCLLGGCSAQPQGSPSFGFETGDNFLYEGIREQDFSYVANEPSCYFSLDKNTASYSQVRAQLNENTGIAYDSVRLEELVNYFDYDFEAPAEGEEMRVSTYLSDCPWNEEHKLVTVGLRTEERKIDAVQNNYVFLVDISGSMSSDVYGLDGTSRLDLAKYGMNLVLDGLTKNDTVSLVTYASGVETKCEPVLATAKGKQQMRTAIDKLRAYGSTNGEGGLQLAYECAERYKQENGNNRIILMTDGDFNVGMRDVNQLKEFVQTRAQSGVYLTVLGLGMCNMRDDLMQTLALNGNGNYAYLDTFTEAERVLKEQLNGTLVTVAKDAKAGVTFQKDQVMRYRLLGYDTKHMSETDFNDSERDAGEIGSGLCVTAVYEVELAEDVAEEAPLAEVTVRYKSVADGEQEKEITQTVTNTASDSDDVAFISCVSEFALVLRRSQFGGEANLKNVVRRLYALEEYVQADRYKEEFVELVERAILLGYGER